MSAGLISNLYRALLLLLFILALVFLPVFGTIAYMGMIK